jgi:predicted Rossmann-fold nucleotide-binding protein
MPEDLDVLEKSLRGKKGKVHSAVREFRDEISMLIAMEEEYWNSTRWKNDARLQHQNVDAVAKMIDTFYGRVSFFGSARLHEGSQEYEGARWLSKLIVEELGNPDGTTEEVITGGGPGIMEAGNRGALEGSWNYVQNLIKTGENGRDAKEVETAISTHRSRMQSIGVRIELPFETGWNPHLQLNLTLPKFPARKEALIMTASGELGPGQEKPDYGNRHPAFFIFKGGIGTKDEGWEVICQMQCGKLPPVPVFIVGDAERRAFEDSMHIMQNEGTISRQDLLLNIGGKNHIIYCKDEREAAKKYVDWHNLTPPPSFDQKVRRHRPLIVETPDDEPPTVPLDAMTRKAS